MSFLSIIIPVYNEEENVVRLFEKIQAVCKNLNEKYEILFVDDGSQDSTFKVLCAIHKDSPHLRVIRFEKNAGQTAAMAAGFEFAQGLRIISLDGDLQNDPADIPKLLEKLDEGYDLICGWRKDRKDKFLTRRVPSIIANWIIGKVMGVPIHDNGCSLKAYRASIIKQVPLYGEMHRFIPAMSTLVGARIAEVVVTHHTRRFGKSKYGLGRIWRVTLDIIAFKFILSVFQQNPNMTKRFLPKWGKLRDFFLFRCKRRPLRFFGPLGTIFFTLGCFLLIGLLKTKVVVGAGIFLMTSGFLTFCFGMLGELLSFAQAKRGKDYSIKAFLNFPKQ